MDEDFVRNGSKGHWFKINYNHWVQQKQPLQNGTIILYVKTNSSKLKYDHIRDDEFYPNWKKDLLPITKTVNSNQKRKQ